MIHFKDVFTLTFILKTWDSKHYFDYYIKKNVQYSNIFNIFYVLNTCLCIIYILKNTHSDYLSD